MQQQTHHPLKNVVRKTPPGMVGSGRKMNPTPGPKVRNQKQTPQIQNQGQPQNNQTQTEEKIVYGKDSSSVSTATKTSSSKKISNVAAESALLDKEKQFIELGEIFANDPDTDVTIKKECLLGLYTRTGSPGVANLLNQIEMDSIISIYTDLENLLGVTKEAQAVPVNVNDVVNNVEINADVAINILNILSENSVTTTTIPATILLEYLNSAYHLVKEKVTIPSDKIKKLKESVYNIAQRDDAVHNAKAIIELIPQW